MKKKILWLLVPAALAGGVLWFNTPPRAVRIAPDVAVGEEVRFAAPGGSLAASYLRPASGDGPVPAVIMITGSGSYSYRSSFATGEFPFWKTFAETFLAKGWAVLLLEKRGVNGSDSSWAKQTFRDRAEDALAGIRYLKSRPEVDPARIGLCGHSQGGWIVQLAAAMAPEDVAFGICLAGPNVSVRRQILDDQRNEWICRGLPEKSVARRTRWADAKLGFYAGVSRMIKIGYLALILNYDPGDIGARIRCPLLALYGENDPLVPPAENARILREGLQKGGNSRAVLLVIPGAGHGLTLRPMCGRSASPPRFAPEFFRAVSEWNPF
jgi:uncharacterized protein